MHLVEVAPLTKIPLLKSQILSYFSARRLSAGALVLIPLGRHVEDAIVIEIHEISAHKMEIKDADYELRPIKKIKSEIPVLTHSQIKLAMWLNEYYFTSPGVFLKMMMPKQIPKSKLQIPNKLQISNTKFQKLILVPTVSQINLAQEKYADAKAVIIHSGLKVKELSTAWQKIASGEAKIIIGTRTAAFAPFKNLKEIIIEDETNSGHRSWDMFPHYRTHEVAQKLAEIFGAKLTTKSDLPSIETNFIRPMDPISRISPMGRIGPIYQKIIDLRQELRDGNFSIFSQGLQEAINKALENRQQTILFINRRGAATFVLCRDCGYVAKCTNCDAPLTYHLIKQKPDGEQFSVKSTENSSPSQSKPILICHHCGQKQEPPGLCPNCRGHRIKAFGSGTQRVEAEAQKLFKNARILRLDSDTAATPVEQSRILEDFKQRKADILIGTQMILNSANWRTKVALVGVISADTLLHLPDFRSDERMFQAINRLRNFAKSNFFIQTYNPQAKIIQAASAGDFKTFYQNEIEARKILKYPPFSQLLKLVFRHRDPQKAARDAKILAARLTQQLKTSKILSEAIFEISGAVPAFIAKEKGKYVWQIILKAKPYWLAKEQERKNLLHLRNKLLMTVPPGWEIDVDPETLL